VSICPDGVYNSANRAPPLAAYQVIVTRFNLAIESYRSRAGIPERADYLRWLAERLKLFEAFCLPSVLKQARRPDLWLLELDGESRDDVAALLAAVAEHRWIQPAWQNKVRGKLEPRSVYLTREIIPRLPADRTHLTLTRLDSDDALHLSFMDALWRYSGAVIAAEPELADFFVTFPIGTHYSEGDCKLLVFPNNHFVSRVQSRDHFLNTLSYFTDHTMIYSRGRVFTPMTWEPMWIQNAHGGNIVNKAILDLPKFASASVELARCGIDAGRESEKHVAATPKPVWRRARRWTRRLARAAGLARRD
jgi:hypothetical protein